MTTSIDFNNNNKNTLYLIIGPSGSGKSTLVHNIQQEFPWLTDVPSYTTRPKRCENETGHIFVTQEEFDKLDLIAYTKFNGYEYGVTKELLDQHSLYIIDKNGIESLYKYNYIRPIITIGLTIPEHICIERLKARGESDESIQSRIRNDMHMFEDYTSYCDILIDATQSQEAMLADFINKVAMFELEMIDDVDLSTVMLDSYI